MKSQCRKACFLGFLILTISVIDSAAITHIVDVKDIFFDRAYKCQIRWQTDMSCSLFITRINSYKNNCFSLGNQSREGYKTFEWGDNSAEKISI